MSSDSFLNFGLDSSQNTPSGEKSSLNCALLPHSDTVNSANFDINNNNQNSNNFPYFDSNSQDTTRPDLGFNHRRLSDLVQDYDWSKDWKNTVIPKLASTDHNNTTAFSFNSIPAPLPPLSKSALTNTSLDMSNSSNNHSNNMNNSNSAYGNKSLTESGDSHYSESSSLDSSSLSSNLAYKRSNNSSNNTKRITAGKTRRNTSGPKTRPAFVLKLWNMVNDKANEKYIKWMPDGQSFQVINREQFEKVVLPKYFKHSNFSSFVRQLNMYGWHKVQDVTSGAMQSSDEMWQFKSLNFIRGREDLLDNIVRNKGSKGSDDEEDDFSKLFDELEMIKANQRSIADDLGRIRKDNDLLWRECYESRERHKAHSEAFEKILRFLASLYTSNPTKFVNNGPPMPGGHKQPLLLLPNLQDVTDKDSSHVSEPNSHTLSAIEDLISNASNTPPASDSRINNAGSHHRISSIASIDDPRPVITEADTPSSTSSLLTSPSGKNSGTTSGLSKNSRNSSRIKLEEVSDEMGPPLTTQNQVARRIYPVQPIPQHQSSSSNISQSVMDLIPSMPHNNTSNNAYTHDFSNSSNIPPSSLDVYNSPQMSQRLLNNNQSLDSLSRNLDMQGHSLQLVQDWVQKLAPDYNMTFGDHDTSKDFHSVPDLMPTNNDSHLTNDIDLNANTNTLGGPTGIPAIDSHSVSGNSLGLDVSGHDNFNVDDFLNNNELLDDGLSSNTMSGVHNNASTVPSAIPGIDLSTPNLASPVSQSPDRFLSDLGLEPPAKRQKLRDNSGK